MSRVIILVEFFIFAGFVAGYNLWQKHQGNERIGEFPIHPLLFMTGKAAMGVSWAYLFVQTAGGRWVHFSVPVACEYAAAVILLPGIIFVAGAFLQLGSDSRFGISEDSGGLRTMGVYRFSRNPMYLGFYLVSLASLVVVPHPLNIGCALVSVYIHHLVVLTEERFLQKKYGDAYEAYKRKVRRYI